MAIESLVALGLFTTLLAGLAWYASRQARSSATAERRMVDEELSEDATIRDFRMVRTEGGREVSRQETDRLERIALIENYAEKVFGDAGMAREWMTSNNAAMGATPLSMLDTETGVVEVRKILSAIAYGGTA